MGDEDDATAGSTIAGEARQEKPARVRPSRAQQPKPKSGLDTEVSKADLSDNLHSLFEAAAFFLKSETAFENSEFSGIANDLVKLSNKFLPLRILLNGLSLVVVAPKLIGKVRKLFAGRKGPQPEPMYPNAETTHAG